MSSNNKDILIGVTIGLVLCIIYIKFFDKKSASKKAKNFMKGDLPIAKPKGAISSTDAIEENPDSVKSDDSTRYSGDNGKEQVLYSLPQNRLNFFYAKSTEDLFPMILVNKSGTVVEIPLYKSIAGIKKTKYKFKNVNPGEKIYVSGLKRLNYYADHKAMSDDMFVTFDGYVLSYTIAERDFGIQKPSKKEKDEMNRALLVDRKIQKAKIEGLFFPM